jgi:hypothetical protein
VVLIGGDEVGRALLGDDLDRDLIGVDLFDKRKQALAGLACGYGHSTLLAGGTRYGTTLRAVTVAGVAEELRDRYGALPEPVAT